MAEQLPLTIKEAVHKYYIHRERQSIDGWNKAADLDLIDTMCGLEGWHFQACAGTFWFSKKHIIGTQVIEVDEKTLPVGGISNIKDDGEPFGALSEIAKAIRKTGKEPLFFNANVYTGDISKNTDGEEPKNGECI